MAATSRKTKRRTAAYFVKIAGSRWTEQFQIFFRGFHGRGLILSSEQTDNDDTILISRSWQQGGGGGGWCAVAETSVAHASAPTEGARGVVLASRYLAQPAGKGRSRLVHLARVDTM